ncbi:MAG TPA: alpha-amylase family protein [Terracidiphilus sp.]|nr:alpha-amylase family protein [Terracidiphilus sp.]
MNRRDFITVSAASLIATSTGKLSAEDLSPGKPWYSTMLRCGQININEQDPLTMDAAAWMDYFASLKVDAVQLNGGGIMAFYPTKVPFHHRSEFLGSRDLFGEVVTAARKRNLRVVSRMDCNYAYEEAFNAHPEWFAFNADGSPRCHGECPWLYKTCMFSTYFTEQMPAIYREINKLYAPDGFYTNGWPGTEGLDVCHCANCQKLYHEKTGGTPPETTDVRSAVYRKYYEVYMDRISEVWKLWHDTAKEESANSVYVGNLGGGIRTVKDVKRLSEVAAWFNADNQGRQGEAPIWSCAQQGRVARSVMNGRTVTNVIGSYDTGRPGWRHTSKTKEETNLWMAQAAASGMVPWFHWLGGQPEDTRWKETGRSFFDWLATNQTHFRNRSSVAHLAVLYPQSTIAFYGSNGTRDRKLNDETIDAADYLEGMYAALLDGRFLFDFVHQENLNAAALKPYRALLIPNAAYLRDSECEAIRAYVASGGSLLATFETSRYNEWGQPREDFGLRDIFGISATGGVIGPNGNSYMRMEQAHPVLEGYKGTTMLPGPEFRVPVSRLGAGVLYLSVIPAYPAFPPEMVFPRVRRTDEPAAVFSQNGASRIVYFPGDIDRTFWRSGHPDFSSLLINSVKWLLNGQQMPATVEGSGMLELFAWETEPGFALHILNYTNPRMMHQFISQFYPTGPLQVRFQVPAGRRIGSVRALRANRDLPFKQSEGTVTFEVPSVVDYEVIALA